MAKGKKKIVKLTQRQRAQKALEKAEERKRRGFIGHTRAGRTSDLRAQASGASMFTRKASKTQRRKKK